MARVAQRVETEVDFLLDRLFNTWTGLPEVDDFEKWDLIDQIVFIEEWAIPRSHLALLEEHVAEDRLTLPQLERFNALRALMAEKQPLLDELLKD